MYNRYIPQSDGTYRRSRMPDQAPSQPREAERRAAPEPEKREAPPHTEPQTPPRCYHGRPRQQSRPRYGTGQKNTDGSIGSFLRQLMPKDFDTGDLLVVVLLLLMSADQHDDQGTALLTLALYLFM